MNNLFLTASATTPYINFKKSGDIQMSGKIILDENSTIWMLISNWIQDYKSVCTAETIVSLQIDYLNVSSLKQLNKFLSLLKELNSAKSKVSVTWYYNESDIYMQEIGFELSRQSGLEFQMKLVKEFV